MPKPDSKHPNLTIETKQFLDDLAAQKSKPLYELDYKDAFNVLLDAQTQEKHDNIKCDIEDTTFPFGPQDSVDVRIFRPQNSKEKLPVIFYIHGGGWVMGNKITHDRLVREITVGVNAAVIFVDYKNSPEWQFPVVTETLFECLKHISKIADELNVDASKLAVCGDSVGGNMAAVMAIMAKKNNGPKLKCQTLLYPVTDASMNFESYKEFADGPWLTTKAMKYFWDAYVPQEYERKDIRMSPINATKEELKGLPHALVITDENDILRDEGEAYAQKLMDAGVSVISTRYNGTIHDFMMLDALKNTEPTRGAIMQTINVLKYHLNKQ